MNLAFAGFRHGHIFGLYNQAAANDMVHIVGCYEADVSERKQIEESRGIYFCYNSYEEILQDKCVDAVAIGDCYGKRGKMIIEALQCGKHVICDKPICTKLSELEEIERLVEEKNLQVCCMLDLRYMPQVSKAKKIIESGELGDIHIVSFTGQHCLNYGKRPKWYWEQEMHGGTINDLAIHGIDLVRFLTGKNLTKIDYVKTWNAFAVEQPEFLDCAQFTVEMEGISLMADVSYSAPQYVFSMPTYWDFYIWGTKGALKFNLKDRNLYLFTDKEEIIECEPKEIDHLNDFMKEIRGEKTIMNTMDILESQRQTLILQENSESFAEWCRCDRASCQ